MGLAAAGVIAITSGGCGEPGAPAPPDVQFAGSYALESRWDLSGPIGADRSVSDVAADLVVEVVVDAISPPSSLEDEARGAVHDAIGSEVRSYVETQLPPELQAGSPLLAALGTTLAQVTVDSELTLVGEDSFGGSETISLVRVPGATGEVTLSASELDPYGLSLGASWDGERDGTDSLRVEPYEVQLRYGHLVLWVLETALGYAGASSAPVEAALDCEVMADQIFGSSSQVVLGAVTVSRGQFVGSCGEVRTAAATRALGVFSEGVVALDGRVRLVDGDADLVADRLESISGYDGIVLLTGLPDALAPRVAVTMSGDRTSGL